MAWVECIKWTEQGCVSGQDVVCVQICLDRNDKYDVGEFCDFRV